MERLREKARELLAAGTAGVVIGYEEAEGKSVRPAFIRDPGDVNRLVFDDRCVNNLALYLNKKEIRKMGRAALVAPMHVLMSVLQLASEKQVAEKDVTALAVLPDGTVAELADFGKIRAHVAAHLAELPEKDAKTMQKLNAMTAEERMRFWTGQLSRCIKCYACRATCPMCFCGRCQVEYNQPQFITVEPTPLGGLEWHFMRAMHLAGRCVRCGECGRACPLEIPVHLLTFRTAQTAEQRFESRAGTDPALKPVMSSFKPDDKEDFIR